jgi:hypothetical protein
VEGAFCNCRFHRVFLKSEPWWARAQKRRGRGRAGLRDTHPGAAVAHSHESKGGGDFKNFDLNNPLRISVPADSTNQKNSQNTSIC